MVVFLNQKKNYELCFDHPNYRELKSKEKAQSLASKLVKHLEMDEISSIERYSKFIDSYKIQLKKNVPKNLNIVEYCIKTTANIAQPWNVYFDVETEDIKMIFNKSSTATFSDLTFNVIYWAQLEVDEN